jgi:protein-S-isoprenylcysteine O-methyltransferase Ste14
MTGCGVWPPRPRLLAWPWRWLGLLPIARGLASEHAFKRAGTPLLPFTEPSALVTTGPPFAFPRNPMYLGLVLGDPARRRRRGSEFHDLQA